MRAKSRLLPLGESLQGVFEFRSAIKSLHNYFACVVPTMVGIVPRHDDLVFTFLKIKPRTCPYPKT